MVENKYWGFITLIVVGILVTLSSASATGNVVSYLTGSGASTATVGIFVFLMGLIGILFSRWE